MLQKREQDSQISREKQDSRNNHSCGGSGICGLEQTNTERPASWPARLMGEIAKNVRRIVSAVFCDCEYTNNDSNNTGKSPIDGKSLY